MNLWLKQLINKWDFGPMNLYALLSGVGDSLIFQLEGERIVPPNPVRAELGSDRGEPTLSV